MQIKGRRSFVWFRRLVSVVCHFEKSCHQSPCCSRSSTAHTTNLFPSTSVDVTKNCNKRYLRCILMNLTFKRCMSRDTQNIEIRLRSIKKKGWFIIFHIQKFGGNIIRNLCCENYVLEVLANLGWGCLLFFSLTLTLSPEVYHHTTSQRPLEL